MFAQFRAQYPQGSIKTKMLPKADGLHVFRATIKHGDIILATATAADPDIEVAEDRAIKRALAIAGISFENTYGMKATLLPQMSQSNSEHLAIEAGFHKNETLSAPSARPQLAAQSASEQYKEQYKEQLSLANFEPDYEAESSFYTEEPKPQPTPNPKPEVISEPIDLSDINAQILMEMDRLNWTKEQGRKYLLEKYKKKARNELSLEEAQQFLTYLKSLATPYGG